MALLPIPAMALVPIFAMALVTIGAGCGPETPWAGEAVTADGSLWIHASGVPAVPRTGNNTVTLWITDAESLPVEGAAVTAAPFMPVHGHGSSYETIVTEVAAGEYQVANVFYSMPGSWELHVIVASGGQSRRLILDVAVR